MHFQLAALHCSHPALLSTQNEVVGTCYQIRFVNDVNCILTVSQVGALKVHCREHFRFDEPTVFVYEIELAAKCLTW